MELSEPTLTAELHRAMKARDATRVSVLRGVIAAIKNARVEHRGAAVTEDQIVALVRREVKQRHEVVELARQGGRRDVLEQTERELAILDSLLPAVLTPEELDAAVRGLYAAGATSIGEIMRGLQAGYPGRVDGKAASTVARRVLAGSN